MNEILSPADGDALDIGQAKAWVNDGTTTLTAPCVVDGGAFGHPLELRSKGDVTVRAEGNGNVVIAGGEVNGNVFMQTAADIYLSPDGQMYAPAGMRLVGTEWPTFVTPKAVSFSPPYSNRFAPGSWTFNATGGPHWRAVGTGAQQQYMCLGEFKPGLLLSAVAVSVKGDAAATALPATMPRVSLSYATRAAPETLVLVGEASDASATVTAFKARHEITLSGLSHSVADGRTYYVLVTSGSGTSNAEGFAVYQPWVTGTLVAFRTA